MQQGRIIHGENQGIVFAHVGRTQHWHERLIGLLGRRSLPQGHGLLIEPCGSVHTFFMGMPIDAVFLGSNERIVRIAANLPPWRMAMATGGAAVLEVAAGAAAGAGLKVDDRLVWEKS
ncbi:MAG: DUF192 domain-containing protein [Desulfobulbaceae bacterium]